MSRTCSCRGKFWSLSNALDRDLAALPDPLSNALDSRGSRRRHRVFEAGAPPGVTRQIAARGPVHPALCILGGSNMTTQ
jgi:hypothetical protein